MAKGKAKGSPKTGGRKKGTPNKVPALIKDAIIKAAEFAGVGLIKEKIIEAEAKNETYDPAEPMTEYLKAQAIANPVAFMTLMGKVLPMQITGADGGPIDTKWTVEIVNADTKTE